MSKSLLQMFLRGTFLSTLFALFFITSFSYASALQCDTHNYHSYKRGTNPTINWSVVGAASCSGGFLIGNPYPVGGGPSDPNDIFDKWKNGTPKSGNDSSNFSGATILAPVDTYTFTCWDPGTGMTGCADLTVTDCDAGESWNGTACVVTPTPTATLTISPATTRLGNATFPYSLTSTSASSCSIDQYQSDGTTYIRNILAASANQFNINSGSYPVANISSTVGTYVFKTTCYSGSAGSGTASAVDVDTLTV